MSNFNSIPQNENDSEIENENENEAGTGTGTGTGLEAEAEAGYEAGYEAETETGYEAGYEAGAEAGYEAGYEAETETGYEAGYEAGAEAGTDTLTDNAKESTSLSSIFSRYEIERLSTIHRFLVTVTEHDIIRLVTAVGYDGAEHRRGWQDWATAVGMRVPQS